MRVLSVTLAILLGVVGIATAFWLGSRQSPKSAASTPAAGEAGDEDVGPSIPIGAQPRAEADETEYDFGTMIHGGTGSHVFTIRNTGEGPLELMARKEDRTCQCTGATLSDENPIPPGGSVQVTVNWEIKADVTEFRHSAKIRTSDRRNRIIKLTVFGKVDKEYHVEPASIIDMGETTGEEPVTTEGLIFSRTRDHFEIQEAAPSHPRISCTWKPFDEAKLAEHEAKSGYVLTFQMDPRGVAGGVSESVMLTSTEKDEAGEAVQLARFVLKLKKPGLVEVIGRNWDPENSRVSLGEFPAGEGGATELSVYVLLDGKVEIVSTEPADNGIKISWEKDERFQSKSGGRQRYKLKVQVPPGPAVNRQRGFAEKMILKFDREEIGSLQLRIDYLSL